MEAFDVKFVKASCMAEDKDGEYSFDDIQKWLAANTPVEQA